MLGERLAGKRDAADEGAEAKQFEQAWNLVHHQEA